jgi:cysteine desulfurase / selenocysteine lyase
MPISPLLSSFLPTTGPIPSSPSDLRQLIIGIDTVVPLLDGTSRPYVFLDNAASTPALAPVTQCVQDFLPWYSGVHRGTGFKSLLATEVFDAAHDTVAAFVGADLATQTVVFMKNTTDCVNKLANRAGLGPDDIVITTLTEHHSNDLPWRKHCRVIHLDVLEEGRLNLPQLKKLLVDHCGRVKLVAVTGASNISGICSPVHDIARWTHEAGARIFVDCAQLAPHRPVNMLADDDPGHLDFVALSAHKMYAPYGTGALIGPRAFFEQGEPDAVGGGVVEIVTLDHVEWNHPPHKEEAGTPNVIGGVALASAISVLSAVGMDTIAAHETALLEYAYRKLRTISGIELYGPVHRFDDKVGVIPFNVAGKHHALVAAILSIEGGIGVRNGCFCAHPFVKHLLGVTPEEDHRYSVEVLGGDKRNMPGMVRASLGCYSNESDIDALVEMLERILRGGIRGTYRQEKASGAFTADGFAPDFSSFFPYAVARPTGTRRHSEAS